MTIPTFVVEFISAQILGVPIVGTIVLVVGHRVDRRRAAHDLRVGDLREALAARLAQPIVDPVALTALLADAEADVAEQVLHPLLSELDGGPESLLRSAAIDAGLAAGLARNARSVRWRTRRRAAFVMSLHPDDADLHQRLLGDRNPLVAHVAAEAIGHATTVDAFIPLVRLFGAKQSHLRFAAQHALIRMGSSISTPLISHIETHIDDDDVMWALDVAAHMGSPVFAPLAIDLASSQNARIRRVSAKLLGIVGVVEAVDTLVPMIGDADDAVRARAISSLGQMGWNQAAGAIGKALGDPSFAVRQAAASALTRLGAVGELVLRHHTNSDDRFASEAASAALISITSARTAEAVAA